MKKLLLLTIFSLWGIWSYGQHHLIGQKDLLDTIQFDKNRHFIFSTHNQDTEKNFSFYTVALDKYPILSFSNSIKPPHYKWLMIQPKYGNAWYVDNPDSSGGKYIIHLNRKNFKWLNDSTAVYSPDSLNKKK